MDGEGWCEEGCELDDFLLFGFMLVFIFCCNSEIMFFNMFFNVRLVLVKLILRCGCFLSRKIMVVKIFFLFIMF